MTEEERENSITQLLKGGNFLTFEEICESLNIKRTPPQFDEQDNLIQGRGQEVWVLDVVLVSLMPEGGKGRNVLSTLLLSRKENKSETQQFYCLKEERRIALNKAKSNGLVLFES